MRKFISKIAGLMLGLSLAAGVGISLQGVQKATSTSATEVAAYTLIPATTGNNSYTGNGDATIDGVTWNVEGNGTVSPWRVGGKNITSVNRRIYSKGAVSSSNITKVVLTTAGTSKITVNSLSLKVGTSAGGSETSTVSGTFAANSSITFERPNGADWSSKYFTFTFNVTNTNTKDNGYATVSSATFYEEFTGTTASVTYYKNNEDATGSTTDGTTYDIGDTVTVLSNGFSLTDYTFDHWNTAANDSGTSYDPNDTFSIDSDTHLYAQWTKNVASDVATSKSFDSSKEYLLRVDYNSSPLYLSGTTNGTIDSNASWGVCSSDDTAALRFTLTGSTVSSGRASVVAMTTYNSSTVYLKGLETGSINLSTASSSIYLYGDGNIYATSSSSFYLQYNYNNGDGGMRWYNNANASRPVAYFVEAGAAPVTYTIAYNANGGSGSMPSTTGAAPEVAACTFTKEGYSFERWNTQEDGEGTDYAVGATVSADVTLYVIWQEYIAPIGANVSMSGVSGASTATVNGHAAVKCGTGSAGGSMSLTINASNISKIKFYIAGWKGENGKTVSVSVSSGSVNPSSLTTIADTGVTGSSPFTLSESESTYKVEMTLTNVPVDAVITLSTSGGNMRFVVWGATDLFAESFANEFNSNLTCDVTGEDGPSFTSGHNWTTMHSFYNGLDAEEQGKLHDATFTVTGTGSSTVVTATGTTVQSVAEAIAKYDYIVAKYGTSDYPNFINRSITPLAGAPYLLPAMNNNNTSTIIIVVVALTSITSIGVLLVIKRKRSLVK